MSANADADTGVRVVVTPTQSSYYAGEPFSVTVTLVNTRAPEAPPARTQTHAHKRGSHSISSAPLARPPTSPGTPRTATAQANARLNVKVLSRKGLVGKKKAGDTEAENVLEQSRKRLLARSLSVDVSPQELEGQMSPPKLNSADIISPSPTSATRSPAYPIPVNHPHARKQSLFDGQIPFPPSPVSGPPSASSPSSPFPSPSPYTPSASTSAFSLALDPIAEGASAPTPYPPTPAFPSPAPNGNSPSTPHFPGSFNPSPAPQHAYPPRAPGHRPPQLGLGHPPPSPAGTGPRSAFSTSFPAAQSGTELVLYAYAQLAGHVVLAPLAGSPPSLSQARTLAGVRSRLLKRGVRGGGSMDIGAAVGGGGGAGHRRSASLSAGLMGLLSPSPSTSQAALPASKSWTPQHRRRGSAQVNPLGVGTDGEVEEDADPEAPMPTFEVQPAMLAVDLALAPGESRTYTYSLSLPAVLPPTFKGRAMRVSYELLVGTCRAGVGRESVSRVMKVPIRVYNNVVVGKAPRPYDLMWPIARRRTPGSEPEATVTEETAKRATGQALASPRPGEDSGTLDDLRSYAARLLQSFPEPGAMGVRVKLPAEAISPVRARDGSKGDDGGGMSGCREAVELLTRNPKKVSYDVNKDGVKVAVLTFTKSAYRLGETVLGVVEVNDRKSRARVLTLAATLEAQELLPSSIAPPTPARHTRRVHAAHHSAFVPGHLRTAFALDIPSDATPAFGIDVAPLAPATPVSPGRSVLEANGSGAGSKPGGLEWKVRLCLLVAVASEPRLKHLVRDGPRGQWGSTFRSSSSLAPLERPPPPPPAPEPQGVRAWASFFTASFLGAAEGGYHDGDEEEYDKEDEEDEKAEGGGEEGWKEVKVEEVECEVPIRVWPGNTAFKAMDVVFDL